MKALVVPLISKHFRFEPVERRGERDGRLPALARRQHPKRRIFGQPLGVVGIFVAGQAAVDGLAEQIREGKLAVASGARDR